MCALKLTRSSMPRSRCRSRWTRMYIHANGASAATTATLPTARRRQRGEAAAARECAVAGDARARKPGPDELYRDDHGHRDREEVKEVPVRERLQYECDREGRQRAARSAHQVAVERPQRNRHPAR